MNTFVRGYRISRLTLARIKAWLYDRVIGIEISESFSKMGVINSFYGRLEKMVQYLKPFSDDVFCDLGCGEGRVVFFMARQKLKKIIGVELDEGVYAVAYRNLHKVRKKKTPVEVLNIDAADFDPKEGTIFYMFNPFGAGTLKRVLDNIRESLAVNPRRIRIVYYGLRRDILLDKQDWLVREGKIENDTCLVWRNKK